ncbi:HAMP domain-containing histidine kinase [Streptomyces sp. KM273126]|uniref:sensor histidine kinase n=1 Tax=Streptomyces sp. KM273126 TaxID=2545247 RepID=UPI00103B257F|nr:HAMP domain-containing sensor histidine kinase [Streptomyces sp. KM273126]MBA2813651.1 HAMP domain-containing histidine kinase [Streptomyces sp. KM273126]
MAGRLARWWAGHSLRLRLTAAAGLVIAAGLAGAALLLVAWLHVSLLRGLDQTAAQRAQLIAAALDPARPARAVSGFAGGDTAVQVIDRGGAVRAASGNLEGEGRLFSFPPAPSGQLKAHTLHRLPLQEADTWRAVALSAGPRHGDLTVYVAVPTTDVDHGLAELTAALALGVPVVVGLLTGVGWLILGRALRPVDDLRAQAARITASDPGRRLDVPPARDELRRLAETLNDLLRRLDAAGRRQREFVADAAHELRSPIAGLRAQLDVALRNPGKTQWEALGPELVAETARLSRLVDDLVQLARIDARPVYRRDTVDLDDVVFTEVSRARPETPRIVVDESAVSAARVTGDAHALSRAVRNLLDNATRHAAHRVEVRLSADGGRAELVVADDGPGIPAAERTRVFGRFTRLDAARARDQGGSGLGLAIVHDIVAAHQGTVHVEDNHPGARFVVHLPIAVCGLSGSRPAALAGPHGDHRTDLLAPARDVSRHTRCLRQAPTSTTSRCGARVPCSRGDDAAN